MSNFGSDGDEGEGHTHGFYESDYGEAGAKEGRREVGDSQVRSNVLSEGN